MNNNHKGFYLRLYDSVMGEVKFFPKTDTEILKLENEMIQFFWAGLYYKLLFILAKHKNDGVGGFAYTNGRPVTDLETARLLHIKTEQWQKIKNEMAKTHELLLIDKKGAWGVGLEKWDIYQGAMERRREYQTEYMKKYRETLREVPLRPKQLKEQGGE